MTPYELKSAILSVKRWSRSDQRAPNKPLMLIYALSHYAKGHEQLFHYEDEVDEQVTELLKRFGPSRKSFHPLYGFWRLINDGFWKLENAENCLPRKSNTDPPKSELIKNGVTGGFNDEAFKLIRANPELSIELIESIISENFPESTIEDFSEALGLSLKPVRDNSRAPNFRRDVLRAYNYQCAVCGYDLRLDDISFGLEAAHIKWKQFHGPCSVNNGLALCSIHHKAFDRGAMGLDSALRIRVSSILNGGEAAEKLFYRFENHRIYQVRSSENFPSDSYLRWHQEEVFKR
ncbi:HNH endonuclease [Alteromonas ponticola]|uniref:HNH endonuclease n=1 Tax=Alteromonas aquimaris TaxID=2998417 RepID=A0ABT3P2Y1_9ALTE|nr:HNH endonuclease [Alteromonas aquimaris]MCW8107122.1 HNH endonuclease [Alteromonas aquimaris]